MQQLAKEQSDKDLAQVVVAMSGGVDSSAAAVMLTDQGFSVIGISMQVWDYRKHGGNKGKATCCAPGDFLDAREIARQNGFPYYVFDFEDSFHQKVISPFVNAYLQGLTPNPCLECNRKIKFLELRERAARLGVQKIATGHYARIRPVGDRLGLFSAKDENKDQSYFLYHLTQDDLAHTLFPVGEYTKPQVRAYLAGKGLGVADKEESYDICFVSGTVAEFIEKEAPAAVGVDLQENNGHSGQIRAANGEVLGEHSGHYRYTVGQRKGLGLSSKEPLYVLNIDAQSNTVYVGEKQQLEQDSFYVGDVHWISGVTPSEKILCRVKLRYRHAGILCEVEPISGTKDNTENRAKVRFLNDWTAVSPGQAAVFYHPEAEPDGAVQVLGGGIIEREAKS